MESHPPVIEWEREGSKRIDIRGISVYLTFNVQMTGGYEMEFCLN